MGALVVPWLAPDHARRDRGLALPARCRLAFLAGALLSRREANAGAEPTPRSPGRVLPARKHGTAWLIPAADLGAVESTEHGT